MENAIISHNIWLVKDAPENEADIRKYREAGLEELIISGEEDRLFLEDAPLLFMLCFMKLSILMKIWSSSVRIMR